MQNEILNRVGTKWEDSWKGANESHIIRYSQGTAPERYSRRNPGAGVRGVGEQRRRWVTDIIVRSPGPSQSGTERVKSLPAATASLPVPNSAPVLTRHMQRTFWATSW